MFARLRKLQFFKVVESCTGGSGVKGLTIILFIYLFIYCNPLTLKSAKNQNSRKIIKKNHFVQYLKTQMLPCKSATKEVSLEWSHHRISLTQSKVRTVCLLVSLHN